MGRCRRSTATLQLAPDPLWRPLCASERTCPGFQAQKLSEECCRRWPLICGQKLGEQAAAVNSAACGTVPTGKHASWMRRRSGCPERRCHSPAAAAGACLPLADLDRRDGLQRVCKVESLEEGAATGREKGEATAVIQSVLASCAPAAWRSPRSDTPCPALPTHLPPSFFSSFMVPGFRPAQGTTSQLTCSIGRVHGVHCWAPLQAHNTKGRPKTSTRPTMMDGLEPGARPVRLPNRGLDIERSLLVQLPACRWDERDGQSAG